MIRPKLKRVDANSTPRRAIHKRSTAKDVLIHDLASTIYAMLKKIKKKSISYKLLKMLIAKHLKLKSKSKAKQYINDLVRLEYMAETDQVYTFRMEAEILLSRTS